MEQLIDIATGLLLLAGSFFMIVGAVGLNRMPDVFSRLHATGISDTVGASFLILGMILQAGFTQVTVQLIILVLIFLFTSPVATHAVTRAALSVGVRPKLFDSEGRERSDVAREVGRAGTEARPAPAGKRQSSSRNKGGPSSRR